MQFDTIEQAEHVRDSITSGNIRARTQEAMRQVLLCRTQDQIDDIVKVFLDSCERDDEPPLLSDLLVGLSEGGQSIMIGLAEKEKEQQRSGDMGGGGGTAWKWHVRVLRDEWGNPPRPGDVVIRKVPKGLYKADGKPRTSVELSRAKVNGTYADKYEDHYKHPVDKKGCMLLGFTAAVSFLNTHGIHCTTGISMTTKQELSGEPSRAPNGDMLHVHYWRYSEAPKHIYEKLPEIKDSKEPRRGLDRAAK